MENSEPKDTGKMEEEEDSEEWGDYNDSDEDSDDDSEGGFDEGSDDDDEPKLEDLALKRVESKAMSKQYPFHILHIEKVKGVLASKLLELRQDFEYANLNDFIIWKTFRDHDFISRSSKSYLQDKVLGMMEKYVKKEPVGEKNAEG